VPGYYHLLEAADDPDHNEFTDRFGRAFDPERFDLDMVNRRLGHVPHGIRPIAAWERE
jgi:hypothetical protein